MKKRTEEKETATGLHRYFPIMAFGLMAGVALSFLIADISLKIRFISAYFLVFYLPFAVYAENIGGISLAEKFILINISGLSYAGLFVILDVVFAVKLTTFVLILPSAAIFASSAYVYRKNIKIN